MSILSLHDATLMLANNCILDQVNWQIEPRDRIALLGRNGAGKSSLLKVLLGELVLDRGQMQRNQGLRVASLTQDVPMRDDETVYHFLVHGLGEIGELLVKYRALHESSNFERLALVQQRLDDLHGWDILPRIDTMASRLQIDPDALMGQLSGGMKRRVLLAAALIAAPDLLLLDEPTNHLDIHAIEWLESYLKTYSGSVLLVTHDRDFLSQVATQIVEIDRGQLHVHRCSYETYLDRREAMRATEETHTALFDKRLKDEEAWLRTGVKARRTRNEGRVRALESMRVSHQKRRDALGHVKSVALDVTRTGNLVIEAEHVNYAIDGRQLVRDFSCLLTRGDKVGIIGPNGSGKTTLVRLLLGELAPDSGVVRQGTGLSIAYFDQLRRQLDEQETVMRNVGEGSDYVTIQGKEQHVASYLKSFLFTPDRFNQPVSSLSGGERNRLLLAKLFARPVNVLVMDEPTNDLDLETLTLLETMLVDYSGTLLLISHDRAFINQVVTSILVYEADGQFHEYVGGYDTYQARLLATTIPTTKPSVSRTPPVRTKRSFNEERELSQLPIQIETLEKTMASMRMEMSNPAFYKQPTETMTAFHARLMAYETELSTLYARWEILENRG